MDNRWLQQLDYAKNFGKENTDAQNPAPAQTIEDQVNAMPNSDKLSGAEKWIYEKLPGVSQNSTVKAITSFLEGPAGKVLNVLDFAAEGLERTFGLMSQYVNRDPNDDFELKDAWTAGSLFWDTANLPRLKYNEKGFPIGVQMDTNLPGSYALVEARKQLQEGKSLEEVRDTYYKNMGALALRAQLNDTWGHVLGDPLNLMLGAIKPVETLHAVRNLALTGKIDVEMVQALEQSARLAGNLEDAAKYAEVIARAEKSGKALSKFDKFAINITGGLPYLEKTAEGYKMLDVKNLTPMQKFLAKVNPFALTPQARASELLDVVAANVGEYLIRPNWNADPEEFIKALGSAARGGIGDEYGHLASTIQGRTVQGILSNSDASVRALGVEWKSFSKERTLLENLSIIFPGKDARDVWRMASADPEGFFNQIAKLASQTPGAEVLLKEIQSGNLTSDVFKNISNIPKDVPLLAEEFYAKALVEIQDVAMKQAIVQFGIKEKGVLTKWSDALKAWESIPFIKANPANAVRNVVNNDITLIGRGLFGTFTDKGIEKFWKELGWIPKQFERGFGLGVDDFKEAEHLRFDLVDKARETLMEKLVGEETIADKVKKAAEGVNLGPADFSKASGSMERTASRRASTVGWIEFHQKYWNPRTGFTSVSKYLDSATVDKLEELVPGLADTLDDVAKASKGNPQKFAELMQSGIDNNPATIFNAVSEKLGYKLEESLSPEMLHVIEDGLPEAIKNGKVQSFIDGVRVQAEQHVDDMFKRHVENLPGIVAAQVQAGGPAQYHRIFGKAMDELWGGNVQHAMRMSTINEALDYAKTTKDFDKVNALWEKVFADSEGHFGRLWNKFEAYQDGLKQGAKAAGIPYPTEVSSAFKEMRKSWEDFFNFRNTTYREFFDAKLKGKEYSKTLEQIQETLDGMYKGVTSKEDEAFQRIDDLMAGSLDENMRPMYMEFRDRASEMRIADREATRQFFSRIKKASGEKKEEMWASYWKERMTNLEKMRQLEVRGSAAVQGDLESISMFGKNAQQVEEPKNVIELANNYGIATATKNGARNDRRVLSTINKYSEADSVKYTSLQDVPLDVAKQAFEKRAAEKAGEAAGQTRAFIPDAEKLFPDPMPIETGLSELNYGRSYAALDAIAEEAVSKAKVKSKLLTDLPEELQAEVQKWVRNVNDESNSFRSAAVQYAAFRRDSALLNYNRRTNFDNLVGHFAPFAFWSTHSIANWAIYSIDRPAMLTNYFRIRQFFETAGLTDQNVPQRMRGQIRVNLPFTPDWMGDTFVNPSRFLLPFDGFMMPWEQAQANKLQLGGKVTQTLEAMLEDGEISQTEFDEAVKTNSGSAWEIAMSRAQEGGEKYDAMDFVSMTMTPHAPLMWAYNAATGQKSDIGPFTPMSRTFKNVATMMGVEDWSNSPYNLEGKLRKSMGLPAYDKWDDYRIGREIANMAGDGKYSYDAIRDAMEVAALVESGQMSSKDAVAQNKVYKDAVYRSNQEYAGGWAGTLMSIIGVPVHAYPTGEQEQRALTKQFGEAYDAYQNGDVQRLTDFFNDHPEYEARLSLFKKPEERLKNFMIDNVWARWNELPQVTRDEVKDQMGANFANNFLSKQTRNYDSIDSTQLQIWLKLLGGKEVGKLDATTDAMLELNQLKLTDPNTAWRVETFYEMRKTQFPSWNTLQNKYYELPQGTQRSKYLSENQELKDYWNARSQWMQKNPDLVRFLTDNEAQLKKYASIQRNPGLAVPTAKELQAQFSQPMMELLYDNQPIPRELRDYADFLGKQYGLSGNQILQIILGKKQP